LEKFGFEFNQLKFWLQGHIMDFLDPELRRHYAETLIEVFLPEECFSVCANAGPGTVYLPPSLEPFFWVITPCNPRSVPLSPAENKVRYDNFWQEAQAQIPSGVRCFEAIGRGADGKWSEKSVAFVGLAEKAAIALAVRHEQNAIYRVSTNGVALVGVLKKV
jgi:hypothetical protein